MWPFTRAKEGEDAAAAALAPPEPTVDLLDHAAVKRALDDAFAEAFLEAGHVEDMRLFNWKFGLGTIACVVLLEGRGREGTLSLAARAPPHAHALLSLSLSSCLVALFAQFYPGKPPATVPLLASCVAAYVALSLAAGGFATWVERDAFLVTRAQQVRERAKKEGGEEGWGFREDGLPPPPLSSRPAPPPTPPAPLSSPPPRAPCASPPSCPASPPTTSWCWRPRMAASSTARHCLAGARPRPGSQREPQRAGAVFAQARS